MQQAFVEPLIRYAFPVTELPESTNLEAVCTIFETLNRTGKPLTTFELISARAFAGGLSLYDYWSTAKTERSSRLRDRPRLPTPGDRAASRRSGQAERRPKSAGRLDRTRMGDGRQRHGRSSVDAAYSMRGSRRQVAPLSTHVDTARRRVEEVASATGPEQGAMRAKLIRWFWCACFTSEYELLCHPCRAR